MRRFMNYWNMIIQRAWKDTRHDFRLETNARIIVALILWGMILLFGFEHDQSSFNLSSETQGTRKWLIAVSILFPIWILVRSLMACVSIDHEIREQLTDQNRKKKLKTALVRLADIRMKMSDIFNQSVTNDTDFANVQSDFKDQMQEAYNVMQEEVSHAAANVFITVPVYPAMIAPNSYNKAHSDFRVMVNNRAEALGELIREYDLRTI